VRRATTTALALAGALACNHLVAAVSHQPQQPGSALTLGDCTIAKTPARCGSLRVPEDHALPLGRQITLKVRVLLRTGTEPPREPVFVLAGGPGQAVTDLLEYFAETFRQVRRNRDIVLVDQRGTGGANRLGCFVAHRTFVVPADVGKCLSRLTRSADLKAYGTENFIQDLEIARASLNYEHLSLWGASYGTRAAIAYVRRFPERVRSLVLASPAPLTMPVLASLEEEGDRALGAVVDDCLSSDARCAGTFPNLRADLKKVRGELTDPYYALGIRFLLYSSATFRSVPYFITEAAAGRWQPLDRAISQFRTELVEQMSIGLHLTIICGEDLSFREVPAAASASPVRRDYLRVCRDWPRAIPAPGFHEPFRVDRPALLIVGEWDPVTSPRWARVAADQFTRSETVVRPKTGHLFPGFEGCLDSMTAGFLNDGAADTTCTSRPSRPPYVLGSR
jgi:pimeloyl-ACP methyl ester carboxylesterase